MEAGDLLAQYWSFFAVAAIVYVLGQVAKATMNRLYPIPASACAAGYSAAPGMKHPEVPRVRSFYDLTLPVWPLLVGFGFGFAPLPVPAWVGDGVSRCFWFLLAGALCGQVFETIQRFVRAAAPNGNGRSTVPTTPPKEPAEERGGP